MWVKVFAVGAPGGGGFNIDVEKPRLRFRHTANQTFHLNHDPMHLDGVNSWALLLQIVITSKLISRLLFSFLD